MEYLKVTFEPDDIRDVLANGSKIGVTEAELILPTNYYTITLSGDGYTPLSWAGLIDGTLPNDPLVLTFWKSATAV